MCSRNCNRQGLPLYSPFLKRIINRLQVASKFLRSLLFSLLVTDTRLGLQMWQNLMTGGRNRHAVLYCRWHWLALFIYKHLYLIYKIWFFFFFLAKSGAANLFVVEMRIDAIEATTHDTLTPVHPYRFF